MCIAQNANRFEIKSAIDVVLLFHIKYSVRDPSILCVLFLLPTEEREIGEKNTDTNDVQNGKR